MDQSDAPHATLGDLHVGDLAGHANYKGKVGEIKIVRRPVPREYQTAGMLMHAWFIDVVIIRVCVPQTVDRITQRP